MGLMDLVIKGCRFSWYSNPRNGFVTREKLDKILVTWERRSLFPDALAISVPATSSDHTPVILWPRPKFKGGKYFRFEAFWEEHEECGDVIQQGWYQSSNNSQRWHQQTFRRADKQISHLNQELQKILNTNTVELGNNWEKVQQLRDDSILFAKADPTKALQLTKILNSFSKASGQRVNLAKSGVIFGGGVPLEVRARISSLLNIQEWANPGRYLGLPAEWGRSRINSLAWLKDRVLQKLDGWRESLLNQAGNEVLIKAVLQAIPTYAMPVIKFPRKICDQIGSQVAKFWWRPAGKSRGIHWKSWKYMTNHKKIGGGSTPVLHQLFSVPDTVVCVCPPSNIANGMPCSL
ncbi:hypothetical protein SESBI_18277 [Sesbania bispinosa]|nr:hypothetical protein SESBI_18277 [Sesbania bispinosa]